MYNSRKQRWFVMGDGKLIFRGWKRGNGAENAEMERRWDRPWRDFRAVDRLRGMHNRRKQGGSGRREFWRGYAGDLAGSQADQRGDAMAGGAGGEDDHRFADD